MPGDHRRDAPRRGILTGSRPGTSVWRGEYRPLSVGIVALITLVAFEGIGTATAMPMVAADLDIMSTYTWAFSGFTAASLVAMVVGGLWSDARGPRAPLIAGVVGFAAGAVIAGLADGLAVLVLGRAIQGAASGLLIVAVYVLIARAYPEVLRPKAFAVLSAAWVVPALVGPFVAGLLAELVSWRAVFLLVPIFVLGPAVLLFPRIGSYEGGAPNPDSRRRVVAGVVATGALLVVQDGLLRVSVLGVVEAAVAVVVLLAALRPLLPAGALTFRAGLPASVMMRGVLASAIFAAEVFVPLALVRTRGLSVTQAGVVLSLSAALWALGSYLQGRVPADRDRTRLVRIGAGVIVAALLALPLAVLTTLPPWIAAIAWGAGAIGMGVAVPSISVQVTRLSPRAELGANSAALQIMDSVLSVVVISALSLGHAYAERHGGATATTYALLWVASAGMAVLALVVAGRMRPATVGEPVRA